MRQLPLLVSLLLCLAPPARAGDEEGPRLGLTIQNLPAGVLEGPGGGGVLVAEVEPGGPGARAGLRQADLLVELDGERLRSTRQLRRLVQESAPGREISLGLRRGAGRLTLRLVPEAEPVTGGGTWTPPPAGLVGHFPSREMGFVVGPLSPALATLLAVKDGQLVSEVRPDSAAARAGLRPGDVLLRIDGKRAGDALVAPRSPGAAPRDWVLEGRRGDRPISLKLHY